MKYYVLIIDSGVEAEARGPFATSEERDIDARRTAGHPDFNRDYDSIFRMDVEDDVPEFCSFVDDEVFAEVTP